MNTVEGHKLGDPLISEEHILVFDWATKKEIEKLRRWFFVSMILWSVCLEVLE